MNSSYRTILSAATALSATMAAPAMAQSVDTTSANDIIVTAQRIEQRLQDVPISITVLDETKLANNNITSAKDIATYTPGLTTNNRYGGDNTTWTIRGFTQEQRTTSTVGTYFADVVAPRGSGATQGGDGAGPGNLFDLQNVQVLKGPQGTLFGRNSTGGAVLLVPRKPTDALEGYVEASVGDYDLRRFQAVVNVPLAETFKVRLGVDRNRRDGYLKNAGNIGFGPHGDAGGSIDYWAARLSIVADLTPDLENYTIGTWSKSEGTGAPPKIIKCYNNAYAATTAGAGCTDNPTNAAANANGLAAQAQMAREAALGFWSVSNPLADAASETKQWQFINTTTWRASDTLTVKNIVSYAEFRGTTNLDLFGFYGITAGVTPGTENALQVKPFNVTHALPGSNTNAESSFVEELQFQGNMADGRLIWQGGLYYEANRPIGLSGIQSTTLTPCADIDTMNCVPFADRGATSLGRLSYSTHRNAFTGKAIYFQSSYDLTDRLKLTGGIRYTWDKMDSRFQVVDVRLGNTIVASPASPKIYNGQVLTANTVRDFVACTNTPTFGAQGSASNPYLPIDQRFNICKQHHVVKTEAPTWVIGLDYKPIEDVLLYAKWSRGYRQGGVASFGADRLQDYDKETVDTYEVGTKASWRGAMPGYFNLSAFYNDFRDQQLQIGLQCIPTALCSQTTAIINAGKSTLKGFEAEAGINPFKGLRLEAAYAYLDTKVKEIIDVAPLVVAAGLPYNDIRTIPIGSKIPNAMPHKVTASANYTLPLPETIGRITLGGTFVYQSKVRVVTDAIIGSNNGVLPSSKLLNLNVNWEDIGGMPIDAAFFVTNVTKEHVFLHVNDQQTNGFASYFIGEPRMWGVRLKYRFGE